MKTVHSSIKKHILLPCLGVLLSTCLGAVPAFAVPVSIQILNGGYNGTLNNDGTNHPTVSYSYSEVHDASDSLGGLTFNGNTYYEGGNTLLNPINGILSGDLTSVGTTITLSNILGTLSSTFVANNSAETITITGGSLSSDTTNGRIASGFLNYTMTGGLNATGTFYFQPVQYLTGLQPGTWSPNYLSTSSLYLWGNNWINAGDNRPTDGSALGLDLGGTITVNPNPVPLPAAAWLFGSGLVSLIPMLRGRFSSCKQSTADGSCEVRLPCLFWE